MHAMRPRALPGRAAVVIDLADDRVLGAGDRGDGGDRGGDGRADRGGEWTGSSVAGGSGTVSSAVVSEKLCNSVELTVIDAGRIPVHQIAEGRPVGRLKVVTDRSDS